MKILPTSLIIILFLSLQNSATGQNEPSNLTLIEPLAIQELMQEFTAENSKHQTIKGFRVQIYNGSKREAQGVRATFLKAYPEQTVALTYETPEYKVQVGNFRTRVEAEALLSIIRATFKGCFVVKSSIDLPETP
jgi:hypothetical protein